MSIPTYVQGFPPDGSSLGSTKTQIRNNLDGTFLTLAVDHIDNNGQPGNNPPGYHNVIHFQDQGAKFTTPALVAGVTQMYTNTDSHTIQQVMLESKAGNAYQQSTMLDAFYSTFGTEGVGWTYIPGGLIMNYGITAQAATAITVNFTTLNLPTFANTNYIINVTPYVNSPNRWQASGATANTFNISYLANLGNAGFYWTALGIPA